MLHMHHMIMLLYDQYIFMLHRPIATLIYLGDRLRLNKADELIAPCGQTLLKPTKQNCSCNSTQRHATPADPDWDVHRSTHRAHMGDATLG